MASKSNFVCKSENKMTDNVIQITVFENIILTEFIFQQLQEFLLAEHTDINNLLNASRHFRDLKKTFFYWKLNKEYCLRYYDDDSNYRSQLDPD
jgi:hypothetical protein